jgi:hypothetical protein
MSAPAFENLRGIRLAVALGVMVLAMATPNAALADNVAVPLTSTDSRDRSQKVQPGRFLIQVLVLSVAVRERADAAAPVVAQAGQGTQFEADASMDGWYRVQRADGSRGWIFNAPLAQGDTLSVQPLPAGRQVGTAPITVSPVVVETNTVRDETGLERRRPQGEPLEPRLPVIDPTQVPPPLPWVRRETLPVPDRWRIVQSLGLLPYNRWDPYHPNVIKGDLPVLHEELGRDWFFNFAAVSDTVLEFRRLPTAVGAQSTQNTGSNGIFGRGQQSTFVETAIFGFTLLKGDTVFRPPDWEFRFVPVVNINRTSTQEVRAVNVNPVTGTDRADSFVGVQELFVDRHLRDVSVRYDFDSLRIGIQPFTADFRGFLFADQPFGVRLFGTRDNNQWQYNAAWFRRLEKDTNSGFNDIGQPLRNDDVMVFNLYRQDWPVIGFTTQGTVLHNRNREGNNERFFNNNGFLERPAIFGSGRPHDYDVTYLGLNGDGHFNRWNISASAYFATGEDRRGMFSGKPENIRAHFGAIEISRDFDWLRLRATGLYASGDRDPFDDSANGFDAVVENPLIAGADMSYWIRQAVPLIGGGAVALTTRNGVLPSLRTSREHGQSNFTNPGLRLFGIGADVDVSPQLRVIGNINRLAFDNLSSLAQLRNQVLRSADIGTDISLGIHYRPLFIQNIVVNASAAILQPGPALRELYGNAIDGKQYSVLINMVLTF